MPRKASGVSGDGHLLQGYAFYQYQIKPLHLASRNARPRGATALITSSYAPTPCSRIGPGTAVSVSSESILTVEPCLVGGLHRLLRWGENDLRTSRNCQCYIATDLSLSPDDARNRLPLDGEPVSL